MRRSMRTTAVAVFATAGLVAGLTGCELTEKAEKEVVEQVDKTVNEPYEVTYEVTGKNIESIEYTVDGGTALKPKMETAKNPTLPWTKTVTLRGIMPSTLAPFALSTAAEAEITCKIIHKGKVLAEKTGKGLAVATGCVAESPIGG
ncbi:MmpS family transport accessory protein [Streptomyces sp. NPDC057638]|uniref:MmpS family transport accessory protein n=1 Tax=Streptomyces sp. NPDC057638 TaxID=3346190 RepID=UPI00367F47CA